MVGFILFICLLLLTTIYLLYQLIFYGYEYEELVESDTPLIQLVEKEQLRALQSPVLLPPVEIINVTPVASPSCAEDTTNGVAQDPYNLIHDWIKEAEVTMMLFFLPLVRFSQNLFIDQLIAQKRMCIRLDGIRN